MLSFALQVSCCAILLHAVLSPSSAGSRDSLEFEWQITNWSGCSQTCGYSGSPGGYQVSDKASTGRHYYMMQSIELTRFSFVHYLHAMQCHHTQSITLALSHVLSSTHMLCWVIVHGPPSVPRCGPQSVWCGLATCLRPWTRCCVRTPASPPRLPSKTAASWSVLNGASETGACAAPHAASRYIMVRTQHSTLCT